MSFSTQLSNVSKKKPRSSPRVSRMATMFALMIERIDRVKTEVDRLDAKLSLQEKSSKALRGIMDHIVSRLDQKIAKANALRYYDIVIKVILFATL